MSLTPAERAVVSAIAAAESKLADTLIDLIGFDTSAREGAGVAHQEADLQAYVGARMEAASAVVDIWEPDHESVPASRQVPAGLNWDGFPQLLATVKGSGGGRALLLNGHIDVVSADPVDAWTSDPHRGALRNGRVYGRGAVDMKGGVASIMIAVEALKNCGIRLAGDLLVNTVTDEESTSAGGVATIARGVGADAAIIPEPSGLNVGVACRGSLMPTIRVVGQSGHAAAVQPHWSESGAISAVEKSAFVLHAITRMRQQWRDDPRMHHALLPPPSVVATLIEGGQWQVSYADSVSIGCHMTYLPGQADQDGYGSDVERAFTRAIHHAASLDPWLAEHPPVVDWSIDVPPSEVPLDHPLVEVLNRVTTDLCQPGEIFGADFWHDGASFTRAGIPTVVFGPGDVRMAHAVDESVPVADLVAAAQGIAVGAMRFCGTE